MKLRDKNIHCYWRAEAFGKIVLSLVSDVVMPPIGVLLGGVNFSDLALTVKGAAVYVGRNNQRALRRMELQ